MSKVDVIERCRAVQAIGGKVVFTNGCFDVLHAGHVRYLSASRSLGDFLVVGLNSDSSIKALKGENRPINQESDRIYLLESLRAVDAVIVYGETEATNLMGEVKPNVYTKGGDYNMENINSEERTVLESCGTEINFLNFQQGLSSSEIIKKLG